MPVTAAKKPGMRPAFLLAGSGCPMRAPAADYFTDLEMALPALLMSFPAPSTVLAHPAMARQPTKANKAIIFLVMVIPSYMQTCVFFMESIYDRYVQF